MSKQRIAVTLLVATLPCLPTLAQGHSKTTSSKKTTASKSIVEIATSSKDFRILTQALKAAGLVSALQGKGPLTVFAPTDAAFRKLPKGTIQTLLQPKNLAQLQAILKYHVIAGRVDSTTALRAGSAKTLQGDPVTARLEGGRLRINNANVVSNDIAATNGVIHVIDTVLLSAPKQSAGAAGLIELAVDRGAPLYNKGERAACAAIYELCARSLLLVPEVPGATRAMLRKVIASAAKKDSDMDRAWALRGGLDKAWDTLIDLREQKMRRTKSTKATRVVRRSH